MHASCLFVTEGLPPLSVENGNRAAEPCDAATLAAAFGLPVSEHVQPAAGSSPHADMPQTWLCGQVSSTFDVARHLDLAPWSGVLAMSQRAGRGQVGRQWISPPGNLYASLALPTVWPFSHDLAALAAGYLAAGALSHHGVRMKWPNDLIMRRNGEWRKVGGLLVEERNGVIVLGLGLNLASAPADEALRREKAFAATTLPHEGSLWELWQQLVHAMREEYNKLTGQGAASWLQAILSRMAFVGQMVEIADEPAPPVRGRFMGLDGNGGLCLATAHGEWVAEAGSLRPVTCSETNLCEKDCS